jgi:hypothetical protein
MKYYNPNTRDSFVMQFGFSYPKRKIKIKEDLIKTYLILNNLK